MSPKVDIASSLALLVDNDRDTRELYAEFLTSSGLRVEQAATADEAIEKAHQLRPDIITTAIGLGDGADDCDLCVRFKVDDRTRTIPVIAVTTWAIGRHVERARDAGCDAVLMKPCSPQDLLTEIERLL